MVPLGWAGNRSQGYNGLGALASAQAWDFQEGRNSRPANHDAGSGAHAHRKETMMRFYQQSPDEQPHRFSFGVNLHTRCMYLRGLDQAAYTDNIANSCRSPIPWLYLRGNRLIVTLPRARTCIL